MSKRLPVCSGRQVVKALQRVGYKVVSQKGSHLKLRKQYPGFQHIIIIPLHRELDRGTLGSIVKRVAKYYPEEEFIKLL